MTIWILLSSVLVHEHQTLLFSATMPKIISDIAKKYMRDPVEILLTKQNASPSRLEHHLCIVPITKGMRLLSQICQRGKSSAGDCVLPFRHQVEKVCEVLKKEFPQVDFLHAGLSQDIRSTITNKYRSGKIKSLLQPTSQRGGSTFLR